MLVRNASERYNMTLHNCYNFKEVCEDDVLGPIEMCFGPKG